MSPDNFAKLFRPKASMCNKILEFIIDDLHYFSYPVPCTEESPGAGAGAGEGASVVTGGAGPGNPTRATSTGSGSGGSKSDIISLFNVVIVTIKRSALVRILQLKLLNLQALIGSSVAAGARGASVAGTAVGGLHGAGVGGALGSLNAEIVQELARLRSGGSVSVSLSTDKSGVNPLNAVLGVLPQQHGAALGTAPGVAGGGAGVSASAAAALAFYRGQFDQLVAEHHSHVAEPLLRRAVEMFSKALFHQEKRQKYVTTQVALILKIQEKSAPSAATAAKKSNKAVHDHTQGPGDGGSQVKPVSSALGLGSPGGVSTLALAADTDFSDCAQGSDPTTPTKGISPNPNPTPAATGLPAGPAQAHGQAPTPHYQELLESIMQQSSLANELRSLYHGLKGGHSVVLAVNGYVALNLRLDEAGTSSRELQPYDTLLQIADADTVLHTVLVMDASAGAVGGAAGPGASGFSSGLQLPGRVAGNRQHNSHSKRVARAASGVVSPALEFVIMNADPTASLGELAQSYLSSGAAPAPGVGDEGRAQQLQFCLEEVYAVARLLCSWGYGRVVGTVTNTSVYSVHPQAPLQASSVAAQTFATQFCAGAGVDTNGFALVLSLFNGQRALREVLLLLPPRLCAHGVDIVVFLLRWRLLLENCKYLVYIPDAADTHVQADADASAPPTAQVGAARLRDRFILKKLRNGYFYVGGGEGEGRRRSCACPVAEICWREKLTEDELGAAVALDNSLHLTQCAFPL